MRMLGVDAPEAQWASSGEALVIGNFPLCIVQPGKRKSFRLAQAVIAGCGGGKISYGIPASKIADKHTPVIIGVHPTTVETLRDLRRVQRPFVTIDNGYFRPYKEGGYFRATTNALQWIVSRPGCGVGRDFDCSDIGEPRFDLLDLEIKPWRTEDNGGPILVVLQSSTWYDMMYPYPNWVEGIITRLRAYTDREIIVRQKPGRGVPWQPELEEQLASAYAVIGYSSAVLLQAAMRGVPICSIGYCASSPLGCSVVDSLMLGPPYRERESVLYALAANQWTLEEIAEGRMWRALQTRYEPEFMSLA